jgi:trans-2,3-dihydro-3-hydroxyanthranilate isomerase
MMFYGSEDPATGSAAGPAIAWLVRHGAVASEKEVVIEQGVEMLRPSRLYVSAKDNGQKISDVFVGGRTIPVAMGRLFLP